jgi:PAS domain S-box-containing protein
MRPTSEGHLVGARPSARERRNSREESRPESELSRDFMKIFLDHCSAVVYAKDREGRYLFVNQPFTELFGVDALGKTDEDLFEPSIAATFRTLDRQVMESGVAVNAEEVVPCLQGVRVFWSVKFPLRDERGHVFALAGISSDITDRKRAEQERDSTLALLDMFLASSPVGFAVIDPELRYARINQTLASLNGPSVEEHIGRRISEVVPDIPHEIEQVIREVFTGGKPLVNMETQLETPAMPGVQRSFLTSFYPIEIGGQTSAVGAVLSEITQQKQVAAQLVRDSELRELFLGVLAHDLRTPLSSIAMGANALVLRDDLPEAATRGSELIRRSAQRMNTLVSQLLDFTRVRMGTGLPVVPTELDLERVCARAIEEFHQAYPGHALQLTVHGAMQGRWDGDRLAQLLSSLLSNAAIHGADGGPIQVTLTGDSTGVSLAVHNRGQAIAPERMATLFQPFSAARPASLRSRGAAEGLGLGLYIAERLVAAHGGHIQAASGEQETVFTVWLPRETQAQVSAVRFVHG